VGRAPLPRVAPGDGGRHPEVRAIAMSSVQSRPSPLRRLARFVALSDSPVARVLRRVRRSVLDFEVPAPLVVVRPVLWLYLAVRNVYYFAKCKLICEPFLKAYCTTYGRNVRAGVFVPFVVGVGDLHFGDGAYILGRVVFGFGTRHSERPTIRVGDHSGLGPGVTIVAAQSVTIGKHCLIATNTNITDSSGHPVDPGLRLAGRPPLPEEVRPVVIEDNVWVGTSSFILPGVRIGEGSVVAAGSVVRRSVPPYSLVMGNPAKVVAPLPRPADAAAPPASDGAVAAP
jgi:acetyltransferase-like isoleucine patch superfamily enzyme